MLRRTGIAIIAAGLLAAPLGYTATAGAQQSAEAGQSVQAAAKPKVKACVHKRSGDLRFLTGTKKKKCKRGWKKVTWNAKGAPGSTGPSGNTGPGGSTGPAGPLGPRMVVKAGNGETVGDFLSIYPATPQFISILIDGGVYQYFPNGRLIPSDSPNYKDAACAGTAYTDANSQIVEDLIKGSAGGSSRVVYRATSPTFGVPKAFQFTTTAESVNQQLYAFNQSGVCIPDGGVYNGRLVQLATTQAPPDFVGPLTIAQG